MKIRTRFIIILLAVSLLPTLAIVLLTRVSLKRLAVRISSDVEARHKDETIQSVTVLVDNYHEMIKMAANAMQLTLKLQAREVEKKLALASQSNPTFSLDEQYGFDKELDELHDVTRAENRDTVRLYPGNISYRYQNYFLAANSVLDDVSDDLYRLETMTASYHNLCKLNRGNSVWHHTTLESGLHTRYPGSDTIDVPKGYDPRARQWYLDAKNKSDESAMTINFDPATNRAVLTSSMPVYMPDGTFAGVTAIDLAMGVILEGFKLPPVIQTRSEMYVAGLGMPGSNMSDELMIFSHPKRDQSVDWRSDVDLNVLTSTDTEIYSKMVSDIKQGISGRRVMEYKGKQALWVYSGRVGSKAALTLIVPIDVLIRLAESTREKILDENLQQIRNAGIVILSIIVISIFVSIIRAHRFTEPIKSLSVVANKLSQGDFSATADVDTGDELQDLAEVFNHLGPKLHQHQQTQNSLALAGAIQKNLLPKQPPKMSNFDIAGRCLYCDETGGDYYDFVDFNNADSPTTGIILGDVTGHGIGAALLMASARSIMRNLSANQNIDLPELMSQFNNQLLEDTHDDKFMTVFYGILTDSDRSLTWSSGGHEPAIWYHKSETKFEELPNTGPLMGCMKDMDFPQAGPVILKKGDILLVGTDGIWESQDISEQMFGKQRLYDVIEQNANRSAENIVTDIIDAVKLFTAPDTPKDDVTLIVIKAL